LRKKLGEAPLVDGDYLAFRSYQLSAEMAALILEDPLSLPRELALSGLRHRRKEVQEACVKAIALKVKHGDWSWIGQLRKSSSISCRHTYEALILQDDVPIPPENEERNRAIKEFALLKKTALAHTSSEARTLFESLQKMRPPTRSIVFGKALVYIREGRIASLLSKVQQVSKEKANVLLAAVKGEVTSADFDTMLSIYEDRNSREKDRYEAPALYAKANALAAAILRSMSPKHLPRLRTAAKTIRLTSTSRGIILALLKYGDLNEFKLVLDRISTADDGIDYWNHTELGRTAARQMEKIGKGIPRFLLDILDRKEFWEYIPREERKSLLKSDLLPIKCLDNRSLYVRLAAYAMIGAAEKRDQEHLVRLAAHEYRLIARAAAIRLVRLSGESALRKLSIKVDDSIQKGKSTSLADALRSAEMELFGIASLW